jgi:hypothetical protein
MSNQKSKNKSNGPKEVSERSRYKKSKDAKLDSNSFKKSKPEIRSKKVKKISKSIHRIESEMSQIQSRMQKIENDLNTMLKFLDTEKRT